MKKSLLLGLGLSLCVGQTQAGTFDAIKPYAKVAGIGAAAVVVVGACLAAHTKWVSRPNNFLEMAQDALRNGSSFYIGEPIETIRKDLHAFMVTQDAKDHNKVADELLKQSFVQKADRAMVIEVLRSRARGFAMREDDLQQILSHSYFLTKSRKARFVECLEKVVAQRTCADDVADILERGMVVSR